MMNGRYRYSNSLITADLSFVTYSICVLLLLLNSYVTKTLRKKKHGLQRCNPADRRLVLVQLRGHANLLSLARLCLIQIHTSQFSKPEPWSAASLFFPVSSVHMQMNGIAWAGLTDQKYAFINQDHILQTLIRCAFSPFEYCAAALSNCEKYDVSKSVSTCQQTRPVSVRRDLPLVAVFYLTWVLLSAVTSFIVGALCVSVMISFKQILSFVESSKESRVCRLLFVENSGNTSDNTWYHWVIVFFKYTFISKQDSV